MGDEIENVGEDDVRRLLDLIKHLPYEAAFWRDQGQLTLPELVHEWGHTFIQFMAGKRVTTPATTRQVPESAKTSDPEKIHEFFNEAFK